MGSSADIQGVHRGSREYHPSTTLNSTLLEPHLWQRNLFRKLPSVVENPAGQRRSKAVTDILRVWPHSGRLHRA